MHDWFCQIELTESICEKKAEFRESSISYITKDDKNVEIMKSLKEKMTFKVRILPSQTL